MFVQLICEDRNQKEMHELYEILDALCHREGIQIEDRMDHVEILACPQGKILVTEDDRTMTLSANTRHAGAGFHAFVVNLFKDIQEEQPGKYELIDDLEYAGDEDFQRLHHAYENELDYVRKLLLKDPDIRKRNYLYDETYYLPMEEDGKILTSTGPMDTREFATKDLHDLMDHFYVWNDWDRDARFYRNAALTLMAKEGPAAYAMMNDQTEKTANEICDYLEIAHEKDPEMKLPVSEYVLLTTLLGREDKLKDCPPMDHPAISYRDAEVYHLFSDAKVVAPGMAERSYDPVTDSINLMAPYKEAGEWSWLIQASKTPGIIENLDHLMAQPAETTDEGTIRMDDWIEDGFANVEAVIEKDGQHLYLHAIMQDDKDLDYIKSCFRRSGFAQ